MLEGKPEGKEVPGQKNQKKFQVERREEKEQRLREDY